MKGIVLFSGGKDSTYSIFLSKKNRIDIKCLLFLDTKNDESYMFQKTNYEIIKQQAKQLEIDIYKIDTDGIKENELLDLEKGISYLKKKYEIECVVSGAIKSTYQSSRIQKICKNLDLYSFNPLWQINEKTYLNDLLKNNFKIMIVQIASYPLTEKFLGKIIDKKIRDKLIEYKKKYKISAIGEGGEFETLVLNSPNFKNEVDLKIREKNLESENCGKITFYLNYQ